MRRMWQKYTAGKRVLALLLAVLMMLDSFTVSAATTQEGSQGVEPEVVVEEVVTTDTTETTEEDLVEEGTTEEVETTEVEIEIETEVEPTEVAIENEGAEVVETEVEAPEQLTTGITQDDFKVYVAWKELSATEPTRIYTSGGTTKVTIEQLETDLSTSAIEVSMVNADGTTAELSSTEVNGSYYEYNFYYMTDFAGKTVTVTIDGTPYTYEIEADQLYDIGNGSERDLITYGVTYDKGAVLELSTTYAESGVFGYITVSNSDVLKVCADDMPAAAVTEWTTNYQSTYGEYGADGKYYCFTYGEEAWYPSVECLVTGRETISYYYMKNGLANYAGDATVTVTDYALMYGDTALTAESVVNLVSYSDGDITLELYKDGQKLIDENTTIAINSFGTPLESALSVVNDDTGCYVKIDASKVKNYEGAVVGLENYAYELYFSIKITTGEENLYRSYRLAPKGVRIGDELVRSAGSYELLINEFHSQIYLPIYMSSPDYVTDISLTSSNTAVLGLRGEITRVPYGDSWSYRGVYLEPKQLGTSEVTISYKYRGEEYTDTVTINVVTGGDLNFVFYDANFEPLSIVNGDTYVLEQGGTIFADTSISPRVLSDIKVTSSDTSIVWLNNEISETVEWTEDGPRCYKNQMAVNARANKTGEVTITLSAKYNGKTVTQHITVKVVEPKGVQVRNASCRTNATGEQNFNVYSSKVNDIYITRGDSIAYRALYDTDAEGVINPANKENYTIEVLKQDDTGAYVASSDYQIVFVNDYIFYLVPQVDALDTYDRGHKLRITSKTDVTNTTDITLSYDEFGMNYLNYDEETGALSNPINEIAVVEGIDASIYFEADNNQSANYKLDAYAAERGISVKTEIVSEGEWYNVVKATFSYDGSNTMPYTTGVGLVNEDSNYWGATITIKSLNAISKELSVPTQREVSDFLNTADSSKDIRNVRFEDYEVSYVTQADGTKTAIIVGYLGNNANISLPNCVVANAILDIGSQKVHAMSLEKVIPVIGVEDGAFDTSKGYTQPDIINFHASHTYFGANESGLLTPGGGRSQFGWWSNPNKPVTNRMFEIIDDMLFVIKEDGSYKCVDNANMSVAPIILDAVTLYMNSPMPYDVLELRRSSNVSEYKLANNYLLTEDGTVTAFRASIENGSYVISADNGAVVEPGTYYLSLIPQKWLSIAGGLVDLPAILVKVEVNTKNEAPEVTMNNEITMNKYLGTDAIVPLNEKNSFGTVTTVSFTPESAEKAEELGLMLVKNGDQKTLLYWNAQTELPTGKLEFEVQFEVAGFTATEELTLPNQKLTVNVIDEQPQTTASKTKITFAEFPYDWASIQLGITNGFVNNNVKNFTTEAVSAPAGVTLGEAEKYIRIVPDGYNYNLAVVAVHNNTAPGIYQFEITAELRTEKAQYFAAPVKVTIEVKGTKPVIQFAEKASVTLNSALYYTDAELPGLEFKNGEEYLSVYGAGVEVRSELVSGPKNATDSALSIRAIYNEAVPEDGEYIYYDISDLRLVADVAENAPAGTYKLNVEVPLYVNVDIVYSTVTVSVKVVNKVPAFKLSSSTATLDGSYVGSSKRITLALDPGYTLLYVDYEHPTVEASQCISVETYAEGDIHFILNRAGITKAGTYKLTPVVQAPSGEIIELKPVNVNVKIANSEKAALAVKTKTININPYAGNTVVDPQFTVKNADAVGNVYYEVLPTSEASMSTEMIVTVDEEGKLHVTDCEYVPNGKYTYNVVMYVNGIYTKPVAITLNVARKALTIKPETSKVTLYSACSNGFTVVTTNPDTGEQIELDYIFAQIPVEIAGAEDLRLLDYLVADESGMNATNNVASDWAIFTYFVEDEETGVTSLVVATPYIYNGNITVTPNVRADANKEFANLKITLNVKDGMDNKGNLILPAAKFENSTVTLNRFATNNVTNTIPDAEGHFIYGMDVTSITLKGKTENVRDLYFDIDNTTDRNSVKVTIKPECIDTIPNGTYVVTAVPNLAYVWGEEIYGGALDPCKFEIKVEDTKAVITVSEKTVNLYPEIGGANTATVELSAKAGDTALVLDKAEVSTTGTAAVTAAEGNNTVTFTADTQATKGANKYNVTVYAKRFGGSELVALGTVKNAVTVNVKLVPATLKMTSTKLKFNPYLQASTTMTVADKELKAMLASGEYQFTISAPVETDSTYKKMVPQLNDVLSLATAPDGTITITAKNLPTAKATYYYSCVYTLHNVNNAGGYKNYEVKFSVAVDNVKPTAQVSAKSVSLDNARMEKDAYSYIILKTGVDVWNMTEMNTNYKVIDSKKNDVTDKFVVSVVNGCIYIGLRARDESGKVVTVEKGNYTLTVTPEVTNGNDTISLADVKVTVKVTSSKPAYVKSSVSLTVNTWTNAIASTQVALKSGEGFDEDAVNITKIVCTKAPTGADADAVHVGFTLDGTLTAWAERDAKAGSYTYNVTPYISRDGLLLELSALKVTVKVDTKQPKAVVSDKAVATVNTNFAGFYSKDLTISLAGTSNCAFGFTKADIATTETNATKKADANKLLEAMVFTTNPDGSVTLNVNLNGAAASVAKGTYKFIIKDATVKSGNYMTEADEAYKLGNITFSVKVENTKPKVTAKATGSIDLLKRGMTDIDIQLSFNKQNYETVENITGVRILENGKNYSSSLFYVSDNSGMADGKISVKADGWRAIAAKNQAVTVEVTTASGNVYTAKVTLKVTQSNVKITAAKSATYYAEANIAEIPFAISDESVNIGNVSLTSVKMGSKKLDVSDFSCDYGYYNGPIIQLQSDNDLSEYKDKTLTCTFEITPYGMASNKKPAKVTVNVVIK